MPPRGYFVDSNLLVLFTVTGLRAREEFQALCC